MDITRTYLNMADGLVREPRAVAYAEKALARLGRTARKTIVRGGTDGSRLTELGLPTPNLSSGAHSIHSPKEWASLEEMAALGRMAGSPGRNLGRREIRLWPFCGTMEFPCIICSS